MRFKWFDSAIIISDILEIGKRFVHFCMAHTILFIIFPVLYANLSTRNTMTTCSLVINVMNTRYTRSFQALLQAVEVS